MAKNGDPRKSSRVVVGDMLVLGESNSTVPSAWIIAALWLNYRSLFKPERARRTRKARALQAATQAATARISLCGSGTPNAPKPQRAGACRARTNWPHHDAGPR
jgi:hypothetical protein